ncbi:hypothetical protein CHS0354_037005 [Potamilus streckersoni]|uniref:Uncharacterized protein n=1 Tax=Potamilus streckersoni TaxID=2493646 RepID=A0AAE0SKB1_9BIVA|nr:hypothetical protein CHS0354_037005 [Potamilus streckersoni]
MVLRRKMNEPEKEQGRWRLSLLSGAFVLASLVNCICRQELFMNTHHFKQFENGYEIPLILTILETVTSAVLVTANSQMCEGIVICAFAHIKSIFLFSYWINLNRKSSFVVGYLEPIILTMLLRICTGIDLRAGIMVSLGLVSLGATLSLGDMSAYTNPCREIIVIFLYIFFISLRNITLKHLKEESLTFSPRKRLIVPYTVGTFVLGFISSALYLSEAVIPTMLALMTIYTSVFIFYLTTLMVQLCDISFLSVIGVWTQVLLNFAVLTQNYVHSVSLSMLGVAILIGGTYMLLLYLRDTESNVCGLQQEVSHQEMYTRMEFLLFVGSAMGLIFYVLQPKISDRDMKIFQVFGFDNLMRKLLFNKQSTQVPS